MDGTRGQSIDDYQGKPKSPGGGFTSFFGWNSSKAQNEVDSPVTSFSDRSLSPAASPRMNHVTTRLPKQSLMRLDIPAANSLPSYFNIPGTPLSIAFAPNERSRGGAGARAARSQLRASLLHSERDGTGRRSGALESRELSRCARQSKNERLLFGRRYQLHAISDWRSREQVGRS